MKSTLNIFDKLLRPFFESINNQFKIGDYLHEGGIFKIEIESIFESTIIVSVIFDGDKTDIRYKYNEDEFKFERL